MDFLPEEIEAYAERFTSEEPELLAELNRFTHSKVLQPRMLAGHLQGRAIAMLSKMIRPGNVLEVGTYTGYSALCWAEGLNENGTVHTIEINDELKPKIESFFERSERNDQIKLHIGNALQLIPTIEGYFDIVYLDADKSNYSNYFDLVFDKVSVGGYIIADNVLWSGKVTMNQNEMDEDTKALNDYANKIHNDPRLENVLLPIRDGLLIARKIKEK
ncbi:MAG: O-methyltransferase [Salibacteraceae bacterium]